MRIKEFFHLRLELPTKISVDQEKKASRDMVNSGKTFGVWKQKEKEAKLLFTTNTY